MPSALTSRLYKALIRDLEVRSYNNKSDFILASLSLYYLPAVSSHGADKSRMKGIHGLKEVDCRDVSLNNRAVPCNQTETVPQHNYLA